MFPIEFARPPVSIRFLDYLDHVSLFEREVIGILKAIIRTTQGINHNVEAGYDIPNGPDCMPIEREPEQAQTVKA